MIERPVGALARCRKALKSDGKVLLVEPYAGDRLEENLNSIGRMYYAASAMACTPNSLSQEVGLGPVRRRAKSGCARWRGKPAFPTCGVPRRRRSTCSSN
jgi:hypothetical protein